MRAYVSALGEEAWHADNEHRSINVRATLRLTLGRLNPEWSQSDLDGFIESVWARCGAFSDRELILQELRKRDAAAAPQALEGIVNRAQQFFNTATPSTVVRLVIAELVERACGQECRGEYLVEWMSGNAE